MTDRTGRPSGGGPQPHLINTEEVRKMLGAATIRSASRTLIRWGVEPVSREAGRSGMNLYDLRQVEAAVASRPGRGNWGPRSGRGADRGADLGKQVGTVDNTESG